MKLDIPHALDCEMCEDCTCGVEDLKFKRFHLANLIRALQAHHGVHVNSPATEIYDSVEDLVFNHLPHLHCDVAQDLTRALTDEVLATDAAEWVTR